MFGWFMLILFPVALLHHSGKNKHTCQKPKSVQFQMSKNGKIKRVLK